MMAFGVERFIAGPHDATIDPRLLYILKQGALGLPEGYRVGITSGKANRPGGRGYHPGGLAADVQVTDPSGRVLPNYPTNLQTGQRVDPEQFRQAYGVYQQYANLVNAAKQQHYPQMPYRWGGYFWNGGPGNYGNADTMHHDVGTVGMGGGSFEKGPSPEMIAAYGLTPGPGTMPGPNVSPYAFGMRGQTSVPTEVAGTPNPSPVSPTAFGVGLNPKLPDAVSGGPPGGPPIIAPGQQPVENFGLAGVGSPTTGSVGSSKSGDAGSKLIGGEGHDYGGLLASLARQRPAQLMQQAPEMPGVVDPRAMLAQLSGGARPKTVGAQQQGNFGLAGLLRGR